MDKKPADTAEDLDTSGEVPNDEDLEKARADAARAENLKKAREKRWAGHEKKAQGKDEKKADKADKPEPKKASEKADTSLTDEAIRAGCRALVTFLWLVATGIAWLVGAKLADLDEKDLEAGAAEAEPLVRRFAWLAIILAFIGFPIWFFKAIASKVTLKVTSSSSSSSSSSDSTKRPNNVTQLRSSSS